LRQKHTKPARAHGYPFRHPSLRPTERRPIEMFSDTRTRAHARTHARTNTRARKHKRMHANARSHSHTLTITHTHTYTHTHPHTRTHTHTHTHTHTQGPFKQQLVGVPLHIPGYDSPLTPLIEAPQAPQAHTGAEFSSMSQRVLWVGTGCRQAGCGGTRRCHSPPGMRIVTSQAWTQSALQPAALRMGPSTSASSPLRRSGSALTRRRRMKQHA
jgi:hypothetical protein